MRAEHSTTTEGAALHLHEPDTEELTGIETVKATDHLAMIAEAEAKPAAEASEEIDLRTMEDRRAEK